MLNVMRKPFIPDSPYCEYLPQNKNFEDFCYRCAILGEPLHSYVPLPQMALRTCEHATLRLGRMLRRRFRSQKVLEYISGVCYDAD